jgi:hypothetical protein
MKISIHESVAMGLYGRKGLETLHEAQYLQMSNGKESLQSGKKLTKLGIIYKIWEFH